jgi:hypothetical protein
VPNVLDFDEQYRSMTDDELLNVAEDSQDLTPEARNSLKGELARRRLGISEVSKYQKEQSDYTEEKFNPEAAYSFWPALGRVRDTIRDWKQYRHQTGEWPHRSIKFYFLHLVVELGLLLLTICYSVLRGWSKGTVIVLLILLVTVDVFVANWLQNKIRLSEIARYRHARGMSMRGP